MKSEDAIIKVLALSSLPDTLANTLYMRHVLNLSIPWRDALYAMELSASLFGLSLAEHNVNSRSVLLFPSDTKRKKPAFIAMHEGYQQLYADSSIKVVRGRGYTIEFVEAGAYDVEGESFHPENWGEEKGSTLWT